MRPTVSAAHFHNAKILLALCLNHSEKEAQLQCKWITMGNYPQALKALLNKIERTCIYILKRMPKYIPDSRGENSIRGCSVLEEFGKA